MARTSFSADNKLARKVWEFGVWKWAMQYNILSRFTGTPGSDMPIIIDKKLTTNPGVEVRYDLPVPLSNPGGGDDSDIEGNEEAMSVYNMAIRIHERNNGVRINGIYSDKLKILNRSMAQAALGKWAGRELEKDFVYTLSGVGNQNTYVGEGTSSIETVNEKAPSDNRIFYGGQTIDSYRTLTSVSSDNEIGDGGSTDYENYLFGTRVIEAIKRKMEMASPMFEPINIDGRGFYIAFIHPLQEKSLKQDPKWSAVYENAFTRGLQNALFGKMALGAKNNVERMFTGAVGVYEDVIIFTVPRLLTRVAGEVFHDPNDTVHSNIASGTARIARAIFCGAGAMVCMWGQTWRRLSRYFDYQRKWGVAIDALYGCKKTCFADPGANETTNTDQEDLATFVVDTAVAED